MGKLPQHASGPNPTFPAIGRVFRLILASLLILGSGCARRAVPDLLEIDHIGPSTLESGTEVTISGNGFPEGRSGTLRLEGRLHTPARRARSVAWSFPLVADSQGELTFQLRGRDLDERLEGAAHATFRGDARVEFEPSKKGRPPLSGSKQDLVLDFFGSSRTQSLDETFTAYLGIKVDDELQLADVAPNGIAARAGLQVNDTLLVLDGVRLDSARDLLPEAASYTSTLEARRPDEVGRISTVLDRRDYQHLDGAMAYRALATLGGILVALLWMARPPRFVLWLFEKKSPAKQRRAWLVGVGAKSQVLAYPIFLLVVVLNYWLVSGFSPALDGLSLLASLAAGSVLLLVANFLLGGARSLAHSRSFSLTAALGASFLRLLMLVPVALAALYRASEVGSLRLSEVARAQDAWPSSWGLFASPWSAILGLTSLLSLLPLAGRRPPLFGHPGVRAQALLTARLCEWAGDLALLALWIALFFGGAEGASSGGVVAGALFSLKLALLAHALSWAQNRMGYLRLSESWSLLGWPQLLMSCVAAGFGVASTFFGFGSRHAELLALFALALATSTAILVFVGSQRSWAHPGRGVDLWI